MLFIFKDFYKTLSFTVYGKIKPIWHTFEQMFALKVVLHEIDDSVMCESSYYDERRRQTNKVKQNVES